MIHDQILLSDIQEMLNRVNSNASGIFSRVPEPIVIPDQKISRVVGSEAVHISEFIIAKIKGRIPALDGHPEITDEIFSGTSKGGWKNFQPPKLIWRDARIPSCVPRP